jgi:hypothetical protein
MSDNDTGVTENFGLGHARIEQACGQLVFDHQWGQRYSTDNGAERSLEVVICRRHRQVDGQGRNVTPHYQDTCNTKCEHKDAMSAIKRSYVAITLIKTTTTT